MLYPIPPTGVPGTGPVSQLGLLVGGSGYPPGTYAAIPATGGHGAGLTLNIVVSGAGVVQSVQIANGGEGYQVGDLIGAILGIGTGFQMTVTAINATGQGPFLMSIGGHVAYQSPAGADATQSGGNLVSGQSTSGLATSQNRWFTDGEKLIRSRAKYELAINVLRDNELAQKMSPHPPEQNGGVLGAAWDAYCMMSGEVNRLQARGMVAGMAF